MIRVRPRKKTPENHSWLRFGAPALVLLLSRFIGVAPLMFTENCARVSFVLWLYGQALATTINGISIWCLIYLENQPSTTIDALFHNKTTRFLTYSQCFFSILTNFVATSLASGRTKSLIEVVKRIDMVKTKLSDNHSHSNEIKRKETILILLYLAAIIFSFCVEIFSNIWRTVPQNIFVLIIARIIQFLSYMVLTMIAMQFILICRHTGSLFPIFNECLGQILNSIDNNDEIGVVANRDAFETARDNESLRTIHVSPRSLNSVIDTLALPRPTINFTKLNKSTDAAKSAEINLRQLNIAYTEICDLVDVMNHSYNGITLLVIVTNYALDLMVTPLNIINKLLQNPISVPLLVLEIYLFLHHFIFICLIVDPGHRVIYETTEIKRTVSKLMGKAVFCTDGFVGELDKLCTKLMMVKPTFSPLGVGTLSRRLIISIISAVATYSVITVQFQSSEK